MSTIKGQDGSIHNTNSVYLESFITANTEYAIIFSDEKRILGIYTSIPTAKRIMRNVFSWMNRGSKNIFNMAQEGDVVTDDQVS